MKRFVVLALVLSLAGCALPAAQSAPNPAATAPSSATPTPSVTPSPNPTPDIISFAVVGDSLTSWDNHTFPYPAPPYASNTWLYWAMSPTVVLAGGWAGPGARAADMASRVIPVSADVLVVQALTNDVGNTDLAAAIKSLEAAISISGVQKVIICAIPPKVGQLPLVPQFNAALVDLAVRHGYTFIDPWVSIRTPEGDWVAGSTTDGVHPTDATAQTAASVIVPAIETLAD